MRGRDFHGWDSNNFFADIFSRIVTTPSIFMGKFRGSTCNSNKLPGTWCAYTFIHLFNSFIRSVFSHLQSDFCQKLIRCFLFSMSPARYVHSLYSTLLSPSLAAKIDACEINCKSGVSGFKGTFLVRPQKCHFTGLVYHAVCSIRECRSNVTETRLSQKAILGHSRLDQARHTVIGKHNRIAIAQAGKVGSTD